MGGYETMVRAGWRQAMRVVERNVDKVDELGTALAPGARELVRGSASPVLLVPGYGNSPRSMGALARSLARDGFTVRVARLPEQNMGPAADAIDAVRAQLRELQAATGAAQVDLVGHSRGGLLARAVAQLGEDGARVGRVVTISSANQGAHLGAADRVLGRLLPHGMQEIRAGAPLIEDLARATDDGWRARLHAVGTDGFDAVLLPREAARIPGVAFNAVDEGRTIGPVSRVTHFSILRDDAAYEALRGALLAR